MLQGSWRQYPNATPMDVQIVDGSGNPIVTFGGSGGTASSFGAAFPGTGTAAGFKDSAGVDMQPGNLDAAGNLKVNVAAGGAGGGAVTIADGADAAEGSRADAKATDSTSSWTVIALLKGLYALLAGTLTVSGTVTANAGTNLNTSTLALEAGGNLAAIKTDTDKIPSQGRALAAASMPVVIPSADLTTLTPPAAITNFALETGGNLATLAGIVAAAIAQINLKQWLGSTAPTVGSKASASSVPVVIASDQGPVQITQATSPWVENVSQFGGSAVATGIGASGAGIPRVTVAYDGAVALQAAQTCAIVNGTTTRQITTGLGSFNGLSITVAIAAGSVATGNLQLFLEDSDDGGTTWDDLASTPVYVFGSGGINYKFAISGLLATSRPQGQTAQQEVLAAGSVRQGPWGDRIRIREKVSGIAGTPTGALYGISAMLAP